MTANEKYLELENQLYRGRADRSLTDDEDDELCERMADLWWDLTDEERVAANKRTEARNDDGL